MDAKRNTIVEVGRAIQRYLTVHMKPDQTLQEAFDEFKEELTIEAIREAEHELNVMMGSQPRMHDMHAGQAMQEAMPQNIQGPLP